MRTRILVSSLMSAALSSAITAICLLPARTAALGVAEARMPSKVVPWDDAKVSRADWGEFRAFFQGEGYGVKDALAAVAVVKPGKALHEAHRHVEEEFLVIEEGSGTWNVGGKEFPLKKGDVLYVEPWVVHGCTNTGKEPLTFFVAKWNSKGVALPAEPGPQGK